MIAGAEALLVALAGGVWAGTSARRRLRGSVVPRLPRERALIQTSFSALLDVHHLTREYLSPDMSDRVDAAMVVCEVDAISDQALRAMFAIADGAADRVKFDGLGGDA